MSTSRGSEPELSDWRTFGHAGGPLLVAVGVGHSQHCHLATLWTKKHPRLQTVTPKSDNLEPTQIYGFFLRARIFRDAVRCFLAASHVLKPDGEGLESNGLDQKRSLRFGLGNARPAAGPPTSGPATNTSSSLGDSHQ